jgi:putative ABC transport system ATP-binding protein
MTIDPAIDSVPTPVINPALIELRSLCKVYGHGDAEVRALDGVNLRIDDGEFVAVMGASGSGKSTFMNIVGCLDVPSSGSYLFRGVDVGSLDRDQLALLRRHNIGFVFQSFNLLPRTTALENVELPLVYRGMTRRERRQLARATLEQVGLGERIGHTPAQLSGGQQQRVAIARALVSQPAVLLADEPTGNLDSQRSEEIITLLTELNHQQGITIVMITHEPDIAQHAARIVSFRDGKIVDDVAPKKLLA